jgi:tetratricopeptide (TPR) repeat protein
MTLYHAHQYDQAIEVLQNGLEMDPYRPFEHGWLGDVYVQKKKYDEAITEFKKALELGGQALDRGEVVSESLYHSMHIARLAHALGVSGKQDSAHRLLDQLKEMSRRKYVPPYSIALIYAGLGEKEQSFEWLERAYQERDVRLVFLGVDPKWDGLRPDPRFGSLVRKIGLAQ